jgi:hypothetical protein
MALGENHVERKSSRYKITRGDNHERRLSRRAKNRAIQKSRRNKNHARARATGFKKQTKNAFENILNASDYF